MPFFISSDSIIFVLQVKNDELRYRKRRKFLHCGLFLSHTLEFLYFSKKRLNPKKKTPIKFFFLLRLNFAPLFQQFFLTQNLSHCIKQIQIVHTKKRAYFIVT